jgi:hypothetical protein
MVEWLEPNVQCCQSPPGFPSNDNVPGPVSMFGDISPPANFNYLCQCCSSLSCNNANSHVLHNTNYHCEFLTFAFNDPMIVAQVGHVDSALAWMQGVWRCFPAIKHMLLDEQCQTTQQLVCTLMDVLYQLPPGTLDRSTYAPAEHGGHVVAETTSGTTHCQEAVGGCGGAEIDTRHIPHRLMTDFLRAPKVTVLSMVYNAMSQKLSQFGSHQMGTPSVEAGLLMVLQAIQQYKPSEVGPCLSLPGELGSAFCQPELVQEVVLKGLPDAGLRGCALRFLEICCVAFGSKFVAELAMWQVPPVLPIP